MSQKGSRRRDSGLPDAWLGEWIGRWVDDHGVQIVRLRLDTGSATSEYPITGTIDLPRSLRFGLETKGWWRTSADVVENRLSIDIAGEAGTAHCEGDRMRMTIGTRTVEVLRSTPVDPERLTAWMGQFTSHTRRITLGMFADEDLGPPFAYCATGDDVVRLYPVGPGRFLTERGETLVLRDYERGAGRYLTLDGREWTRARDVLEERVRFKAGEIEIGGTLIRPAADGPHPAVVLVQGEPGGRRDFLRMVAHPLVNKGVAALIYDKTGHGESQGSHPNIFDQATTADAAWIYLRSRRDIQRDKVGLWAIGNGMWAAPMVAAYRKEVAFLAGFGPPGVSMAMSEVYRRTRALHEAGISPAVVSRVDRAWSLIFAIAGAGAADDETIAELELVLKDLEGNQELRAYQVPDYARSEPLLSPVPPSLSARDLVARLVGTPDPELAHDPVASYHEIRCPVDLHWGADDRGVPVDESNRRIGEALAAAGNTQVALTVHPGAGHALQVVPESAEGLTAEQAAYSLHGFAFVPGLLDDLATWVAARR